LPRIAIPQPHSDQAYSEKNLPVYLRAIELAGGEPLVLPIEASQAELARMLQGCAAALLPGCHNDVDPARYNQPRDERTSPACSLREAADELILQDAFNMSKPVLGICYGLQALNVWRQGSLIQHLETNVQHARLKDAPEMVIRHEVEIKGGSLLASILPEGLTRFPVQSSHHQAVGVIGDRLRRAAISPQDDVTEALEMEARQGFVIGVQWHPERSVEVDGPEGDAARYLFAGFVAAARLWRERATNG